MQLRTRRFLLRDFTETDVPAFVEYHNDPRSRELYAPEENTPEHAARLVSLFIQWADESPRLNYQLPITHLDRTLIGCCGLCQRDAGKGKAELGIELAPACWGSFGYALEILAAIIHFGFTKLGLVQITGKSVSANTMITRIAAAFGAVPVNISSTDWMSDRGWQQIHWQINRSQWESRTPVKWL